RGIQEEMTMKWMQAALLALIGVETAARPAASEPWHITGTLSEACTCTVPCTCNFGESPSPHAFCYAMVGMDIEHGNYGAVTLDGLRVGGANGAKGFVFYVDDRANAEQAEARRLAYHDALGNAYDLKGVNSNQGRFDWSDTTPVYFR